MNRIRLTTSIALTLVFWISGGCRDSTAPDSRSAPISQTSSIVVSSGAPGLFDDAQGRILPAMEDRGAGLELQALLLELSSARSGEDAPKTRRALAAARRVLARMAVTEHPANLAAIRLALLNVEALLNDSNDDQSSGPQ
jgi:hypothetical protein